MHVKKGKKTFADISTDIVANAKLLERPSKKPTYLKNIHKEKKFKIISNLSKTMMNLISSPNIASKIWVYSQYDHEVGIRTVIKPGRDSSVLRLDNGKFLSAKIDGNPKHCYINPREGAIGCFEEACRNVVCTGGKPIGMLDHLQFGNPEDPEIFWTFLESLKGLTDFAKYFKIPCIGGKVSLYNETSNGSIKPTPLIGVLGLIDQKPLIPKNVETNDCLVIIGKTKDELGGSEFYEYIHKFIGGKCPIVNFEESKRNMDSILEIIGKDLPKVVHDCSKGGLAIAASEICMTNKIGCNISLEKVPGEKLEPEKILFSESHSRYLLVLEQKNLGNLKKILTKNKVTFEIIGKFGGKKIQFTKGKKSLVELSVDKAEKSWLNSLKELVLFG